MSSSGYVTFVSTNLTDRYEYQVGTGGAFVRIDRTTAFLAPAGALVGVHALDVAGNIGPESWVAWTPAISAP